MDNKNNWMPFPEYKPVENKGCLVTTKFHTIWADRIYYGDKWWDYDDFSDNLWSLRDDLIIAWMYMPDPYRGDEE